MNGKRRKLLYLLTLTALALLLTGVGVWNFFGFSLPLPPPTRELSALAGSPGLDSSLSAVFEGAPLALVRDVWSYDAQELLAAPPVVVENLVYVAAGRTRASGRVLALDLYTGRVVWTVQLDSIADHAPVVAGDLLYIGVRTGRLLALDRRSGQERWSFQGQFGISGAPVVEDGVLYLGCEAVYALDAASGAQRWRHHLAGRIVQPLAHADGVVAAIGADHSLYLINAWNGKRRLSFPLWFNPSGELAISGETVAITGDSANVQALNMYGRDIPIEKTVRFWWTRLWLYGSAPRPPLPPGYAWQVRAAAGGVGHLMASDDRRFYLGVDDPRQTGRILALDNATGEALWEVSFPSPVTSSATVLGSVLVAGTTDGKLIGLEIESGKRLWDVEMTGPVLAAPTFAGNLMLTPLGTGVLQATEFEAVQPGG